MAKRRAQKSASAPKTQAGLPAFHRPAVARDPAFDAWVLNRWRGREAVFVASFELERQRAQDAWCAAAKRLAEIQADLDAALARYTSRRASALTLAKVRGEYGADLADARYALSEAQQRGEWLVACRAAIWLGRMVQAAHRRLTERKIA